MAGGPITLDNIEGLTEKERALYKQGFNFGDLTNTTVTGPVVNGVKLPDIINGKVVRRKR
ncbi:hypothetical protein B0I12_002201 [Microbacterium hydrothermale]|uniref:hypothetical protein n=1 Tax=Microbacterium hydrothermale TaxID=857427 RepID=UPI0022266349|nr:hypothetical protein [Microbacterium hydrothermale]MCW2165046.1 hypothetical protein [Microbacterium hydrothermale]